MATVILLVIRESARGESFELGYWLFLLVLGLLHLAVQAIAYAAFNGGGREETEESLVDEERRENETAEVVADRG